VVVVVVVVVTLLSFYVLFSCLLCFCYVRRIACFLSVEIGRFFMSAARSLSLGCV
jgi:hypothetical protein